jgi:anti-anti-sigma regulatory factor
LELARLLPFVRPVTFRIERTEAEGAVVLAVSGDIACGQARELEAILDDIDYTQVVLDLKNLGVVDRAGVRLLARSQGRGASLKNCPAYVKDWIERENS